MHQVDAQLRQLGQNDQDRQGIHEARHHRLRHEAHLVGQAQVTPGHLQHPGEDAGCEQILKAQPLTEAVAPLHQARHQQGGGAGGRGDHGGAAAHHGEGHRQQEGAEQSDPRIHAGDTGEGDRFGNHREGHHQAREDVAMGLSPPLLEGEGHHWNSDQSWAPAPGPLAHPEDGGLTVRREMGGTILHPPLPASFCLLSRWGRRSGVVRPGLVSAVEPLHLPGDQRSHRTP
jgi:hypothetical protein